jgi:hypothetical protein
MSGNEHAPSMPVAARLRVVSDPLPDEMDPAVQYMVHVDGLSLEQARNMGRATSMGALIQSTLQAALGNRLSTFWFASDGRSLIVQVVGEYPSDEAAVAGALAPLALGIPVGVVSTSVSWSALCELVDEIGARLAAKKAEFMYALGPDPQTSTVEMTMPTDESLDPLAAEIEQAFAGRPLVLRRTETGR